MFEKLIYSIRLELNFWVSLKVKPLHVGAILKDPSVDFRYETRPVDPDLLFQAKIWIEGGDPSENRLQYAAELMEQIKFPLIHPSSDLNEIKDVDFMKTPRCMELLLEGKISKRNPKKYFYV